MSLRSTFLFPAALFAAVLLSACPDDGEDGRAGANAAAQGLTLIELNVLGRYLSNVFDEGAAEIVAHDPVNQRLFVVNSAATTVDVLDIGDAASPSLLGTIDASAEGGGANSLAVFAELLAVAIEAEDKTEAGKVVFYNTADLSKIGEATVGALPDMLLFTADGSKVLVANEGEPSDDYSVDPEGSVSIVDISNGAASPTVTTAGFTDFNGSEAMLRAQGVRIFGPGASAAQDFEPEYIALSADGETAWVALQENNAVAVLDIDAATITQILPLGTKNHQVLGNELDVSNKDDAIRIQNWPVHGMYQPDAMASYTYNGKTYYITANEGDSRDYDGFSEEFRVADLQLDADRFPDASIQDEDRLGRLKVTSTAGVSNGCDPLHNETDIEADCVYDQLFVYGARSFSIWNEAGALVFDSGSEFERIIAQQAPESFNSSNDENGFDDRSDDKGPEPEGVTVGVINGQTFAFIGLERVGGIMVYNVTNPQSPQFVQYLNNRDFTATQAALEDGMAGDLGPEGLAFIAAADSPTGGPLLVVGNEVSGTTTLYRIDVIEPGAE